MKPYIKKEISNIQIDTIHGGTVKRQILVDPVEVETSCLEAFNKGFIKPGNVLDWNQHENIDEITIVIKGVGKYYCNNEITDYKEGDLFIVHSNQRHKIVAEGNKTSEFYWIRLKTK